MSVNGFDGKKDVVVCHVSCSAYKALIPFLALMSASLMLLNANLLNFVVCSLNAQHFRESDCHI